MSRAPDRRTGHHVDRSRPGRVHTDRDRRTRFPFGAGPLLARRVRRHPRRSERRPDRASSGGGRRSSREANTVAARGQVCAEMPELHERARRRRRSPPGMSMRWPASPGRSTPSRVRAQLVEQAAEFVDTAAVSSVDWFERHVRDLARRLSADDGLAVAGTDPPPTVPASLDRPPDRAVPHPPRRRPRSRRPRLAVLDAAVAA